MGEDEEDTTVVLLVVVYSSYDSTSNVSSITNCVSVANRPIILSSWSVSLFVPSLNRRRHCFMFVYVIITLLPIVSDESWVLPFFKLTPPPLAPMLPRPGVVPRGRRSNECNRPTILVRKWITAASKLPSCDRTMRS